jgi:phage terminase small subunit
MEKSLTVRERHFVDNLLEGQGKSEAALNAGYSPKGVSVTAARLLARKGVRAALDEALERAGISDDYLMTKLRELLEATDMDEKGNARANWVARARAMDMALRMRNAYKSENTTVEMTFEERIWKLTVKNGVDTRDDDE